MCALALMASAGHAAAPPVFPPSIDLASMDGTIGFAVYGALTFDNSGTSVSSAGDINGDGHADILIGAPNADPNGQSRAGAVFVVFGGPGIGASGSIDLAGINGTNGFVIHGIDVDDRSGQVVSSVGDVNGDGTDDLVLGARYADPGGRSNAGETYVVFGGSTVGGSGVVELSSLSGTDGFVINGIDPDDRSGTSVSGAGDVNHDGVDDILIGARDGDPNGQSNAGETYVVFGGVGVGSTGTIELSAVNGSNGYVINGIDPGDASGAAASSAGDVNGDGVSDILIGAFLADPGGRTGAGESYVVFGGAGVGSTGTIDLSGLSGPNGYVINGIVVEDRSGTSVSSAADINADGVGDIVIGAPQADPDAQTGAGATYVVFGGGGVGSTGTIDLSDLTGPNGFVITGWHANDQGGTSVSDAGDVNNDGFEDVIIGAPGVNGAGAAYIVFGGPGVGQTGRIRVMLLDSTNGFVATGYIASGRCGASVSAAGDLNSDGIDDVVIAAPEAFSNSRPQAGECYVLFGRAPICVGDINGDGSTNVLDFAILAGNFATTVTPGTGGDLNGDGFVDIVDFNVLASDFGCGPDS